MMTRHRLHLALARLTTFAGPSAARRRARPGRRRGLLVWTVCLLVGLWSCDHGLGGCGGAGTVVLGRYLHDDVRLLGRGDHVDGAARRERGPVHR
jgi:hypothetical protein